MLTALHKKAGHMLGYPINCSSRCADAITPYLDIVVNNLGDPYGSSNYSVNSFAEERAIVFHLAKLFHLAPAAAWGYVTASGSEGNWRGLSLGLRRFAQARVYCSDKAHYSVFNACEMMRLSPVVIPSLLNHSIDADCLGRMLDNKRPAVICLTAGTTMSGAIDDIARVCKLVADAEVDHYIHIDAALSGFILPFLQNAPAFDFALPIDSISVSGHKMLGCPFACGVFISRRKHRPVRPVEYIGANNATLFGSRNGLAPLAIWHNLKNLDLPKIVGQCITVSQLLLSQLDSIGWSSWRNEHSNTVMLARPANWLIEKWQLAIEGEWAHVITMPRVGETQLAEFVADLKREKDGDPR